MTGIFQSQLPSNDLLRRTTVPATTAGQQFRAAVGLDTSQNLLRQAFEVGAQETEFKALDIPGVPKADPQLLEDRNPVKTSTEILDERYRDLGMKFDVPMTDRGAKIRADGLKAARIREDIIARGPGGVGGAATVLAGSLVGFAIDPLEVVTGFIPVVSTARMAGLIARFGAVRGRALAGVTEGVIGNALFEPFFAGLSISQQRDYGMADALMNVGIGGLFGGAIGTAGGVVARRAAGRAARDAAEAARVRGDAPFDVVPGERAAPLPDVVKRMDVETRIQTFRNSLAQIVQGKNVDIHARARGEPDTVARHTPGGHERPQNLVDFISQNGGINDLDATFRGEIAVRGNPNTPFAGKLAKENSTRNLDDFAELAHEEGFIPKRDVGELLKAIDETLGGNPRVRESDIGIQQARVQGKADQIEAGRQLDAFDRANEELRANGVLDATPEEISRVANIMERDGVGAEEAFERVAIQDADTVVARETDPRRDYSADFDARDRANNAPDFDEAELDLEIENLQAVLGDIDDSFAAELARIDQTSTAYGDTVRAAAACFART